MSMPVNTLHTPVQIASKKLVVGPCSAESFDQLLQTATQIAKHYNHAIFRAGVWKPRTKPGMFEGAGADALPWLVEVKKQTGLKVATEVAHVHHVEKVLAYGIDAIWIGARTTVNPFFVQEIAETLKGVQIPVLIKNPLHPDLNLWIGAMERIAKAGITDITAVHRGFYTYEKTAYRNAPRWELLLELKIQQPNLPVICDISHIAGNTHLLAEVAQQGLDLNVDGLMVETHYNPEQAKSDADQQITPEQLHTLLSSLKYREAHFTDGALQAALEQLRHHIDTIDAEILKLLSHRMQLVTDIAALKDAAQVSIFQMERWRSILHQSLANADALGLHADFVKNLFIQIHDESIRIQSDILNKTNN
jgi:chorismate mutase